MNEELEQLIQEIKSLLPWLLAAGIVVAGYHGIRKYRADRRAAAAEVVSNAYTTEELEDATAKFKGANVEGVLKLRLAKSYFDSANYESALEIYESLDGITEIVFDCTDIDYVSSAGLRVLLATQKAIEGKGTVRVQHASQTVSEVFRVTKLSTFITVEED